MNKQMGGCFDDGIDDEIVYDGIVYLNTSVNHKWKIDRERNLTTVTAKRYIAQSYLCQNILENSRLNYVIVTQQNPSQGAHNT